MIGLTRKQAALLAFLKVREATGDICPSYEEMTAHLGLKSKSGVHRLILALEERGYIERLKDRARSIRVLERPRHLPEMERAVEAKVEFASTEQLRAELQRRGFVTYRPLASAPGRVSINFHGAPAIQRVLNGERVG